MYDLEFFFDPVCPFCWVTSEWVRMVEQQRDLNVNWRFISLAMLNEGNYDDKPAGYPDGHMRGLEMLRVAAAARASHGPDVVGNLYEAMGKSLWRADGSDIQDFDDVTASNSQPRDLGAILTSVGLPAELADAATDESWDKDVRADTEEAQRRAGDDVGTPILAFSPPDGPAFFGPVVSELPSEQDAGKIYDAVVTLANYPSFAELKRSLRSVPNTPLTRNLVAAEKESD